MRLHKMLEFMLECDGATMGSVAKNVYAAAASASLIPTFDFGDISTIDKKTGNDLLSYAKDLAGNGLFHLPFEEMTACFRLDPDVDIVMVLQERGDGIVEALILAANSKFFAGYCDVEILVSGSLKIRPMKTYIPDYIHEGSVESVRETIQIEAATFFCGLTAMLNAKGVEQRVTPPPERLNKRRMAAGKPPIGEVREIFLRVGGTSYRPSGAAEKGSHASPRLHWRRGHVRRLASGEITHVRPHLVGSGMAGEEPTPKTYRVATA